MNKENKIRNYLFDERSDIDKINKNRIISYDIMRGLAVVFMVFIHVLHVYGRQELEMTVLGGIAEFLGGPPAAPTFMVLMGIFFVYSNKGSTKQSVYRGLNLLLIGFVLNLVRGVFPYFVLSELRGIDVSALSIFFRLEYLMFTVDILIFAGFAYMAMALIYHITKKPIAWIALAVIIGFASPLLWSIPLPNPPLEYLANIFWGEEYLSTFPLFPWLVFPIAGMCIGRLLQICDNQSRTINRMALWGIGFLAIGGGLIAVNFEYFYHIYGRMGAGAIIAIFGFVLIWQWAITKLHNKLGDKIKTGFLAFLSKYVLQFYFIHWVLIMWGILIFAPYTYSMFGCFIIFIAVTAISMLLSMLYVWLRKKN